MIDLESIPHLPTQERRFLLLARLHGFLPSHVTLDQLGATPSLVLLRAGLIDAVSCRELRRRARPTVEEQREEDMDFAQVAHAMGATNRRELRRALRAQAQMSGRGITVPLAEAFVSLAILTPSQVVHLRECVWRRFQARTAIVSRRAAV